MRLYASGQPVGARADSLLYQAKLALEDTVRLKVVRKMYEILFKKKPPAKRSVQLFPTPVGMNRYPWFNDIGSFSF